MERRVALERAGHGRPDGDDAPAAPVRSRDGLHGCQRDLEALGQRQPPVERGVAARRQAGRVRHARDRDATTPEFEQQRHAESEAGGRRLDRPRPRGEARLHVPQLELAVQVAVLHGPPRAVERAPKPLVGTIERDGEESRRVGRDGRDAGPQVAGEGKACAGRERWRRGAVLGARAPRTG
ncbi:MAG: hypothetical protein ABIP29_11475, partial [Candidatus Eisenbacteria bacterium]